MTKKLKILFTIMFIGAFGVIGYSVVQKSAHSQEDEPLLSSSNTGGEVGIPTAPSSTDRQIADILGLLSSLQNVKLNTSFFTSPEFLSLEDLSQPIPPATNIGRPNPFAPIGVDLGVIPQDENLSFGDTGGGTAGDTGGGGTTTESNLVTTNPATQVGRTTAIVSGSVVSTENSGTKSFFYGTTPETTLRATASATTGQNFSATLTGLTPNTTYYAKAVIEVSGISISGATITFKTTN